MPRNYSTTSLALIALLVLGIFGAPLSTEAEDDEGRWDFLPERRPYAPYLADPLRPAFGASLLWYSDTEIPDTGDQRFGLKLGGLLPMVAWHPAEHLERPWTLSFAAGFNGQFDLDRDQDNVGWDGIYGVELAHRLGPRWAVKVGSMHTSAHIGDEWAARTGRERIDYTREELVGGVSWHPTRRWRLYGDLAWAYVRRTKELQDPGRAQLGTEVYFPFPPGHAWESYVALDANSYEERDWEVDLAAQAGVRQTEGPWRFALSWASGRVPLGEFFFHDETYASIGAWYDLGDWRTAD